MTVGEWLSRAEDRLTRASCADPEADSQWMLAEATAFRRSSLRLRRGESLTDAQLDKLEKWLSAREEGQPLQYVLGSACFMGLRVKTDSRALIPRPETETLAELAIKRLSGLRGASMLDLCCGTGAIGLSVKRALPSVEVTLSDISGEALSLARENAEELIAGKAAFRQGDLFDAIQDDRFNLIACNPPYLSGADMLKLQPEVAREPRGALYGGEDGLDFYRRLAARAADHLEAGGVLLMEIGMGQDGDVLSLFRSWPKVMIHPDLAGIPRVVEARSGEEMTYAGR